MRRLRRERRSDPTLTVTRPRIAWEGQRRTVLHPLEYAALLTAARHDGPHSHALVAPLGMHGLRVSEACGANITDLHDDTGYELPTIIGKSRKPAHIRFRCRSCGPSTKPPATGRPDRSCSTRQGTDNPRLRRRPAAPTDPRHRAGAPDQLPQPPPDVLHRRPGLRRPAPRHAVRHAAQRLPDHPAVRHEPRQPRPARRPPRRRLPRPHGRRIAARSR